MSRTTRDIKSTRKLTVLELAKKEENRLKVNNKKQTTQTSITKFINCQSRTQTRTIGKKLEVKPNKTASPKSRPKPITKTKLNNSNKKKR